MGGGDTSVVTFDSGEGADSIIKGFTITNGSNSYGAGILAYNCSPAISNCIITENEGSWGGGIYYYDNPGEASTINNCIIKENEATDGAGIYCGSWELEILNCLIYDNQATGNGGEIRCIGIDAIINCTIVNNEADKGGGIYNSVDSTITNCIFWANTATTSGDEIYDYNCTPTATYCDVEGGYTGTGNIDSDPAFVDAANGDYHLKASSPCIDDGDNSVYSSGDTDIDGDDRKLGATIDIGADECSLPFAHWKLDETGGSTAYDSSGHSFDGSVGGDPNWVAGVLDGAMDFDGSGDYISIADDSIFDTGDQITVSHWFNTSTLQSGKGMVIHDGSNYKYLTYLTTDSKVIQFYIRQDVSGTPTVTQAGIYLAEDWADGQWHHVAGVFDQSLSADRLKLYVDGALKRSKDAYDEPIMDGDEGIFIGRWRQDYGEFQGKIDDVRIYDRALAVGEIAGLYAMGN